MIKILLMHIRAYLQANYYPIIWYRPEVEILQVLLIWRRIEYGAPPLEKKAAGRKNPACFLYPPIDTVRMLRGFSMSESETKKRNRPDHDGKHRLAFERNKKKILASQNICGICGQIVDRSLKYPHPMSPCIDHIIPIDRGGHPSDINNLQLAHWKCNREKANKLIFPKVKTDPDDVKNGGIINNTNRNLPLTLDWSTYRSKESTQSETGQ